MLHVAGTYAVIHPGTVVIHFADATIADTTVMGKGWFEGLALTAHRQLAEFALFFGRYRRCRNRPRVRQHRLDVTGQGHTHQKGVPKGPFDRYPSRVGQEHDRQRRVPHQEPHHKGHYGPRWIGSIQPYPIIVRRPRRTIPTQIVEVVLVILLLVVDAGLFVATDSYTGSHRISARNVRFFEGIVVLFRSQASPCVRFEPYRRGILVHQNQRKKTNKTNERWKRKQRISGERFGWVYSGTSCTGTTCFLEV